MKLRRALKKVSSRTARLAFAVALLLPLVATVAYSMMNPHFLAAAQFGHLASVVAPVFAVISFGAMLFAKRKELSSYPLDGSYLGLKAVAITIFSALFGYSLCDLFLTGPLAYAMHLTAHLAPAVRKEHVLSTVEYGYRGCHRVAKLSGDTFLLDRELCSLRNEQVRSLEHGGDVTLRGTASIYGFSYDEVVVLGGR